MAVNVNHCDQPAMLLQGVPEKTAQSFTHDIFGIVRRKMKIFAPKCSAEIAV